MAIRFNPRKSKFGVLFGAVFFISGLVAGYFSAGKMSMDYLASQDWQKVPAQITSLELISNSGDSTTYSIDATYSYRYKGIDYQNDRVSLSDVSDNIGSYWQDLYQRLNRQRRQNKVLAWLDPNKPQTAVLDRTLRTEMLLFGLIFAAMFSGIGAFFMWLPFKSKNQNKELRFARNEGISSNQKTGHKAMLWLGSIFYLIGSLVAFLILPAALREQDYAALFVLIFAVVGFAFICFGLKNRAQYKSIGPTALFLDPLPGSIGGQIGGYFDVASRFKDNRLKITTSCLETIRSGKRTSTRIRWQESTQAYCKETSSGSRASFVIDCPSGFPASTEDNIRWQAEANGLLIMKSQSHEFSRSWEIPVGDGAEVMQSNINIPESHIIKEAAQSKKLAQESALLQIPIKQQGQILEVLSAAGRAIGAMFVGALIGLIFASVGVYTIIDNWWPGYFFVAIGGLLLVFSIFTVGRKIETRIDTQLRLLLVKRSWFFIPLYKREILLFDPSQFSIKKTSSSQTGTKMTEYYALYADKEGKRIKFAEGIEGRNVADALLDNITQQAFPSRY